MGIFYSVCYEILNLQKKKDLTFHLNPLAIYIFYQVQFENYQVV